MNILNIAPFGGKTLMTIDAYHQYAPFHAELRQKILEGGSIFYSWTNGLGKDFLGQVAYYTLSPFSLLPLLFSEENILLAMHLMIVIKSILASMAAAYMLGKLERIENATLPLPYNVILALLYSFSGFFAAFYWDVMWLDAMYLLPLLLLGLYELSRGLGKWRYMICLVACLITNYFMGVILLLCSIPLYIALLFRGHTKGEWKAALLQLAKFVGLTLLAVGLSSFLLYPARGSLEATDAMGLAVENPLHFFSRFCDVITQHLMGAETQLVVHKNPYANAYSGLLALLLLPLYFMLKKVPRKQKIITTSVLVLYYLYMNNELFDYIVHAFHINKGLPHRFAFLYTMIFVLIARRVLLNRDELSLQKLGLSIAGIAALCVYSVIISPDKTQPAKISAVVLAINILILGVYAFMLIFEGKNERLKKVLPLALLIMVCFEIGFNQHTAILNAKTNETRFYTEGRETIDTLRQYIDDDSFYRMETLPQTTNNDGSLYGFPSLSSFNSIINLNTARTLQNLGYPGTAVAYNFSDNTPFMTSLFNVKYLYDRTDRDSSFEVLYQKGIMKLYKNNYTLPIGFMASHDVLNYDLDATGGDTFALQNHVATILSGEETVLLHSASQIMHKSTNVTLSPTGNGRFNYTLTSPETVSLDPVGEITFNVNYTGDHWLAMDTSTCDLAEIVTPSGTQIVSMGLTNTIISLGELDEGDLITIRLHFRYRHANQRYFFPEGEFGVYLAGFDYEAYERLYGSLSASPFEITSFSDNTVTGNVDATCDGIVFFSIPYGSGWRAYASGHEIETTSVLGKSFLAIDTRSIGETSGEALEITLKYQTPEWQKGLKITATSIFVLVVILIIEKRKTKEV